MNVLKVLAVLGVLAMAGHLLTLFLRQSRSFSILGTAGTANGMANYTASADTPQFFIVVCRGKEGGKMTSDGFQRQLRQISVLLKSAASLTNETLTFNIVADSYETYQAIADLIASWPSSYRQSLVLGEYKEMVYPAGTERIKMMFRPCATGRLFLPQLFPDKDAAVYVDTDTLFLRPPEQLWGNVHAFNTHQAIGIAPCLYMYGPSFKKFPTYGSSGLNTGVVLMNLTRLRAFEGDWVKNIMQIVDEYTTKLGLADQDILNILFSNDTMAKRLYELGCEWNYRVKLCSEGKSRCPRAHEVGVGVLHGAALTFIHGSEHKFKEVFKAWEQHQPGESMATMVERLSSALRRHNTTRGCSKIPLIDDTLLHGLQHKLTAPH